MRSVVMVTYNGAKYVEKQYNSIINQLSSEDELIISDDGSSDGTIELLENLSLGDLRVRLLHGPQQGVIKNFAFAIQRSKGELIFLSDQDDVWYCKKIEMITQEFEKRGLDIMLIMHNGIETSIDDRILKNTYPMWHGICRNILKSCYYGHRMVFRKKFIAEILPFPDSCSAYDQYIGLVSEKLGVSYFFDECLTNHIMSGENLSKPLSISKKIQFRINLLRSIYVYSKKKRHMF